MLLQVIIRQTDRQTDMNEIIQYTVRSAETLASFKCNLNTYLFSITY